MAEAITGVPSFGAAIQVLTSAEGITPKTFATVFGVGDIDGPSVNMGEIDTTSHSTGVPIKTFIPGLIDPGTLSFPCFWNPGDPTQSPISAYGLEKLFYQRTVTSFRLVAPDTGHTTREFRGFVKELGEAYPLEGVVTKNTVIRIAGAMSYIVATVTLTPSTKVGVLKAGETGTIAVTSSDTVGWFPTSDQPWVTFTAPTAPVVGAGSVTWVAAAYIGTTDRTANLRIGDKTFILTQLGTP